MYHALRKVNTKCMACVKNIKTYPYLGVQKGNGKDEASVYGVIPSILALKKYGNHDLMVA